MGIVCKTFTGNSKTYGQHTYLSKILKHFRPEFYAQVTLSSQVLLSKHYIFMYLNKYLTEPWLSAKENNCRKNTPTTLTLRY